MCKCNLSSSDNVLHNVEYSPSFSLLYRSGSQLQSGSLLLVSCSNKGHWSHKKGWRSSYALFPLPVSISILTATAKIKLKWSASTCTSRILLGGTLPCRQRPINIIERPLNKTNKQKAQTSLNAIFNGALKNIYFYYLFRKIQVNKCLFKIPY